MRLREAVIRILREAGQPLHVSEITRRVLQGSLWTTRGKTPEATLNARIAVDIKRNGDRSVFVRVAPSTFSLRDPAATPSAPKPRSRRAPESGRVPYSFLDAAGKVLDQFGGARPMHYRQITAKALAMGWLVTQGRTPEATLYAQVLTEIKRMRQRGEQPRFVQHGKGYVGLSRWMGKGLAFEIEQHNRGVRQELRKQLLKMHPDEFEELVSRLLAALGFDEIEVTRKSADGGIDVRGTLVVGGAIRTRMAVQVKRWKPANRVQAPSVQQMRGSLGAHEQGLIITTSDFTSGARVEAARPDAAPVALMGGEQLVALLVENDICVSRSTHHIIELADEDVPGS